MEAAVTALDPIKKVLDECAAATEPPCDFETLYSEYSKAIDKISRYVYPEATQQERGTQ